MRGSDPQPAIEIAPGACPKCGARTVEQANLDCRPHDDDCPGCEFEPTPDGQLQFVTSAYLRKLDAWIDRQPK